MAQPCQPFANPAFIDRTEEVDAGGYLAAGIKQAEAARRAAGATRGASLDQAFIKRQVYHLRQMLPFDKDEVEKYLVKQGWITPDEKAPTGFRATKNTDKVSIADAVTKTYLESLSSGTKMLADNFLRKIESGDERAYVEGLAFARQMQHISRLGQYVLGWDFALGRSLREQGLRNVEVTRRGFDDADALAGAIEANPQYVSKFNEIAQKLQSADQRVDGINELVSLARQVRFLQHPWKVSKVALGAEIAGRAWEEVFVNGLLSGPATFATNAVSPVWVVARPLMQLMGSGAYAATGLPGGAAARQSMVEAMQSLAAIKVSVMDAAKLGWHAARSEVSIYQDVRDAGLTGEALQSLISATGSKTILSNGMMANFDRVGSFVRLPSRAMLGVDEFAKHLAIRAEVAAQAVKRAAREGVELSDQQAITAYVEKEADMAFNLHRPELHEKYKINSYYERDTGIRQMADEATFQEENALANSVQGLLSKAPMLKPFVPFVRTPLNILKQGFVESTGVGALYNTGRIIAESDFNPTRAVFEIQQELLKDPSTSFRIGGQIALTTSLAAAFYSLAMDGTIVGGGPGRWSLTGKGSGKGTVAQKAWEGALRAQGRSPYTVMVGGSEVPFDRFPEPIAIVLRMAADMGAYSSYVPHRAQEEWLVGFGSIMASGLYQASFLRGVNDLMEVLGDSGQLFGTGGGRLVQNWFATQTPFGGLLNYVDKTIDPYAHAYKGATLTEVMRVHEDTFGTGIFARVADRIPGFGGTPLLVDQLTGLPVPSSPGGGFTGLNPMQRAIPFMPRGVKTADSAWEVVWKIKGTYTERTPSNIPLTHAEQQRLNKLMGTIRIDGITLGQAVLRYSRREDVQQYMAKPGAAFAGVRTSITKELDRIIDDYFDAAYVRMASTTPEVERRVLLRQSINQAAESNDTQRAIRARQELDDLFREAELRGVF